MSYKKINETKVYRLAFELAMKIFEMTKKIPKEEMYSLTDQIRSSGGSVCSSLTEAHRKRLYLHISFQKYRMLIWKMQKLRHGWNSH